MSLVDLKIKQRLLREELAMIESKAKTCSDLLHQRKMKSQGRDQPDSIKPKSIPISRIRAVTPVIHFDFEDHRLTKPSVKCPQLASLHQQHLLHDLKQMKKMDEINSRRPLPGPGRAGAYKKNTLPETLFPIRHSRNEIPCALEHVGAGNSIFLFRRNQYCVNSQHCRTAAFLGVPSERS